MRHFIFMLLICFCQPVLAQSPLVNRFATDPYGHNIKPVRIPNDVEKRTVRLGEMKVGEHVQAYSDALVVDDEGRCWLKPNYIAFPLKNKSDLEIINNKLGYIVRVNYRYVKTENGYSVPRWASWTRGYVSPGYIPVKGLMVDKPHYDETSPSRKLSIKIHEAPAMPPNPYSLSEKYNVRPDSIAGSRPSRAGNSPRDFILPELFDGNN